MTRTIQWWPRDDTDKDTHKDKYEDKDKDIQEESLPVLFKFKYSVQQWIYDTLQAWGYDSLPRRQQNSDG